MTCGDNFLMSIVNIAPASEPTALVVKNGALKDPANRTAMKLGYDIRVVGETEEKQILAVVTLFLTAIMKDRVVVTY